MNRWRSIIVLGSVVAVGIGMAPALAQHGHGDHKHGAHGEESASVTCPVTDEAVNLAMSVTTDEGPVFMCCGHCMGKYKAAPGRYAAKVVAQRKALADRPKVQVTCPVSGEPVDGKSFAEHGGQKVSLCCTGCASKYEGNPAKYAAALANSYTYQTKCPVMGEEINPKSFTAIAGKGKIFYCCNGCDKKLHGAPAKYLPKLASQGYTFTAGDLTGDHKGDDHKGHDHGDDHKGHDHGH